MQHLDQKHLAERWLISPRTLEQWRWQGRGPRYLKIGGRVVYRIEDEQVEQPRVKPDQPESDRACVHSSKVSLSV